MEKNRASAGLFVALVKIGPKLFKAIPSLLKAGKAAKGGLLAGSAASYTVIFGWKVAVMIIILLFLHEGGHLWAMKKRGMKTKGMYFIPFLGAAAVAEEEFPSRESENYVALMGPTVGLALSALSYVVFLLTDDLEFAAAAGWMALINLINLIPILPLDGGRVVRSIAFSFGSRKGMISMVASLTVGVVILAKMGIWLFVVLIPIGLLELIYDFRREQKSPEMLLGRQRQLDKIYSFRQEYQDSDSKFYFSKQESEIKKEIKQLTPRQKMSRTEMVRGIVWSLLLTTCLFFVIHYASVITGDQSFYEILK